MAFDPENDKFILFQVKINRPEMVMLALVSINYDTAAMGEFKGGWYRPLRKPGITAFVNEIADPEEQTFIVPFNQTLEDAQAQIEHYFHKPVIFVLR
jgi:hypothetical protein